MYARFLADGDLNQRIVIGLKRLEPDIDFEIAGTAVLEGMPDPDVLQVAARQNRILVSHDRRTMPAAFYDLVREGEHPGLILVKQRCPIGVAIEDLRICYYTLEPEDFANRIRYLPL